MTDQNQKQLGKTFRAIADQLRRAINADDFRDYMMAFSLVFRPVSSFALNIDPFFDPGRTHCPSSASTKLQTLASAPFRLSFPLRWLSQFATASSMEPSALGGYRRITMANFALYAHLKAKPEKRGEVETLLKSALTLAQQEKGTITWYAFQEDEGSYGIFDTFDTEEARQAHLDGPIAKALMSKAGELLVEPPQIHKIRLLADKH